MEDIQSLGVGGILLVLVLRQVFDFLKSKEINKKNEAPEGTVKSKIDALYAWHNVKDEDGVPVWYVRKDLKENLIKMGQLVERLAKAEERQIKLLDRVIDSMNDSGLFEVPKTGIKWKP